MSHADKSASSTGVVVYLQEELGDARLRCNQLKDYINEAVELIEKSEQRDHFFEVAGHLLHGIPDTMMRMEKALSAAAMAVAKWDYESVKEDLRPEKAEQLEDALKDLRVRRVQRRSSTYQERRPMKTHEAAEELDRIASSLEESGELDAEAVKNLVASLEGDGRRTASSAIDTSKALRGLAESLTAKGKSRPSRAVLASALRRVLAETMHVGSEVVADGPEPIDGPVGYNLVEGLDYIRNAAVSAYRRGSTGSQTRQAFDQLATIVSEIGLLTESVGSTRASQLSTMLSKEIRASKRFLKSDMVDSMMMAASEKVALMSPIITTQMVKAFNDGAGFGDFDVGDVQETADWLEVAAAKCARLSGHRLSSPPIALFKDMAERVHTLAFNMGAAMAAPQAAIDDEDIPFAQVVASRRKVANVPIAKQLSTAFLDGAAYGDYSSQDVPSAARNFVQAVRSAARYVSRGGVSGTAPMHIFKAISEHLNDLVFSMGAAGAVVSKMAGSEEKLSRFEEGKPADPTENMSEEDAAKWKTEHENNKDNFKPASRGADAWKA